MSETSTPIAAEAVRETVRAKYAEQARRVTIASSACCEPSCCGGETATADPITGDLYAADDVAGVPEDALKASLGCGNPTAVAELHEGETVLDLGSGGGIDVILSAKRVGPTGFAYGLDMTDEMLALARVNAAEAGVARQLRRLHRGCALALGVRGRPRGRRLRGRLGRVHA